jgi:hypothetical protein
LSGTLHRQALVSEENSALLILDGLDENRDGTPRGVMTLSSALPSCDALSCSRPGRSISTTFANYRP